MTDGFIKKIHKLKNCGVFREWPQNFEFGRYTLIYGWNGTGKTTFSRLMRSIEKEKVDPALEKNIDHEFQFKLHDDTILESNALIGWKNKIRVFNVDFVRENINSDNAEASPVYHLGKDQGEALAALQKVNDELTKRREEQATIKTQIDQNEKGKAKFLTKNASIIKDASSQANFDSPKLAKIFSEYKEETHDSSKYILSDDSLKAAIATAAGVNGKDRLFNLSFTSILDASKFHEKMGHTLENCISKTAIAELDNDADLKNWVERGQVLHKGKKICGFCTNEITQSRIEALESYFNEAYKNLQKTIDALTLQLSGEIAAANSVKIIDAANFYPETQLAYQEKSTKFDDARKKYIASLKNCLNTLTNKKENLTTKLPVPNLSDLTSPATTLSAALAELM
ncbi:MAG: hypothetical protein K0R10_446 [Alphaproteobacteria bacterium]|nr:hypothetical protein [Alphaproteobacteria bacterium]